MKFEVEVRYTNSSACFSSAFPTNPTEVAKIIELECENIEDVEETVQKMYSKEKYIDLHYIGKPKALENSMTEEKAKDEQITILQGQRKLIHERLKNTHRKLFHAQQLCNQLKEKYSRQRCEFEAVDRELAMIDGRYTVIPLGGVKKDPKIELSQDQILDIAKKLGIEVRMNKPREEDEDEDEI